jgi:DNA polymerase elongation subunit (family B)
MHDLIQKKSSYKSQGLILEEKAIKLYANVWIGAMGRSSFAYYDIRVAELITAFGSHAIINLANLLESNGAKILYGDTDSLFISGLEKTGIDIVKEAKERFGLKFSLDKRWKVLALNKNKKQYFGITLYPEDGKLESTKFFGTKQISPNISRM